MTVNELIEKLQEIPSRERERDGLGLAIYESTYKEGIAHLKDISWMDCSNGILLFLDFDMEEKDGQSMS